MEYVSDSYYRLADRAADAEMAADPSGRIRTKRRLWESMGSELEKNGCPAPEISARIAASVEKKLRERLGYEAKINTAYYHRVMAEHGWQNPDFVRNTVQKDGETDPPRGSKNSLYIPPEAASALETLAALRRISANNVKNIDRISKKLSFDPSGKPPGRRESGMAAARRRIATAASAVSGALGTLREAGPERLEQIAAAQERLAGRLDGRQSVTVWRKAMAVLAMSIGYDSNEIARFLDVTAKHVKNNIYGRKSDILQYLEWFDRCPNPDCGIRLSEYFDGMARRFRLGTELPEAGSLEIEMLRVTGYQAENLRLAREVKRLERLMR